MTSRVVRLRGYGNAVNSQAAQTWVESYLEAIGERPDDMDDRGVRVSVFD